MRPAIEIPQTVKISPLSTKPVPPTRSSAVTVVEISDPTAVGETIEVIEQDAVQLKSRPLAGPTSRRSPGYEHSHVPIDQSAHPHAHEVAGPVSWRSLLLAPRLLAR